MQRIFITSIDSSLGWNIVEIIRDDHTENSHRMIIGSCSTNKKNLHEAINQTTTQFNGSSIQSIKLALSCDIILINLRQPTLECQHILKVINNTTVTRIKPIKIIGIGTHMTSTCTKINMNHLNNLNRQEILQAITNEQQWPKHTLQQQHYQRRVPHYQYNYHYQLENILMSCNEIPLVSGYLLSCGILYGNESQDLQPIIMRVLFNEPIIIYGSGNNILPCLHLSKLEQILLQIIQKSPKQKFYAVTESKQPTQLELIKAIQQYVGCKRQPKLQELNYINKEQCFFSSNIKLEGTVFECDILQNIPQLFAQFYKFCEVKPIHAMFTAQSNQWFQLLKQNYPIINSETIESVRVHNEQTLEDKNNLKHNNNNTHSKAQKQELNKYELYKNQYITAINSILISKQHQHYILAINQELSGILRNLLSQQMLGLIILIQPDKECNQNEIQIGTSIFYEKMHICRSSFQNINTVIQSQESVETKKILSDKQRNINESQFEKTLHKINKIQNNNQSNKCIKQQNQRISQYLLDNIIPYIVQVKHIIKHKQKQYTLTNIINQLKLILSQQTQNNNKYYPSI